MFSVNTSSNLPYSTKSSLQALLRSRRELSKGPEKCSIKTLARGTLMQSLFNVNDRSTAHFETEKAICKDLRNSEIDQNEDFTYSQKLFHIADGNLYSILSPLQGRSYGMKPSFLRKQKYTVQECRGRGRKILRKGLKFHNFLPSESVTSEKRSTLTDDQWKVHSECKLREEHGTKQITISNWFHNVKHASSDNSKENENLPCYSDTNLEKNSIKPELEFNENSNSVNHCVPLSSQEVLKTPDVFSVVNQPKSKNEKSSFLNNLLLTVSDSCVSHVPSSPKTALSSHQRMVMCNSQKRRRKPEQTRRIVPYTQYLSLVEETETGPLDLSLHSPNNSQESTKILATDNAKETNYSFSKNCNPILRKLNEKPPDTVIYNKEKINIKHENSQRREANNFSTTMQPYFSNSIPNFSITSKTIEPTNLSDTFVSNNTNLSKQNYSTPYPLIQPFLPETKKEPDLWSTIPSQHSPENQKYCKTATSKNALHIKPRKKSQRSVIKQKLEDTFKQNGFLVKTKQVSDGEATFCKFRQLRKYTRYYLKSWQQHLPDEVHKMWKGFLPPKTALPPISGTVTHTGHTE